MARSFRLPRFVAGLAVIPFAAALASACGGSDIIDTPDGSTLPDGSVTDAHGPDTSLSDGALSDGALSDGATRDTGADTGLADGGTRDADAAIVLDSSLLDSALDADAAPILDANSDADANSFVLDSGTAGFMESLGTAAPFVVLGSATITNTGTATSLTGDVGTTGPSIVGLTGHPFQPTGLTEINNARASTALLNAGTAYTSLTGRPCPPANHLTGQDLGGMTLAPGVYCFTSDAGQIASTTLTFDAKGDPNAVWIIQVGSALTIMDHTNTVVINGPPSLACRIFWTAGTGITINNDSKFLGNLIASSLTSMLTNATLSPGRAFGLTAGVTMLSNTISAAACP